MTTRDEFAWDCVWICSMPSTELIAFSTGLEIKFSTSSGAASSYAVAMTAIGKSIFGNKSTAKLRTDTVPNAIIANTIIMTPTGRLTDNDTILTTIYHPLLRRFRFHQLIKTDRS